MSLSLPSTLSPQFRRLLVSCLLALPVASACGGDDEGTSTPPANFDIEVRSLDNRPADGDVALRCDGTLSVAVAIGSSDSRVSFTLRPANACGSSGRCGFVRIEALTADESVLAVTDSVTSVGVLRLAESQLPELARVRASLISGVNGKPFVNPDKSKPTHTASPTFEVPSSCPPAGGGGTGGEGGAPAGGAPAGGVGGAAGEPSAGGADGAGGAQGGAAGAAGGVATGSGGAAGGP